MPIVSVRALIIELIDEKISDSSNRTLKGLLDFNIKDELTVSLHDRDIKAIKLICSTPLGMSVSDFCSWKCIFEKSDDPTKPVTGLLSYIIDHQDDLVFMRPNTRYIALNCEDDCVPVLTELPDFSAVHDALCSGDNILLGSWCISASVNAIDSIMFMSSLSSSLAQYESKGDDWFTYVIGAIVPVIFSSLVQFQDSVALLCLKVASKVGQVTFETIQHLIIDYIKVAKSLDIGQKIQRLGLLYSDTFKVFANYTSDSQRSGFKNKQSDNEIAMTSSISPVRNLSIGNSLTSKPSSTLSESRNEEPTKTSPMSSDSCHKFIQSLLVSEFDYSVDGSPPSTITPNAAKLQNALQHLAGRLYGSEVHFVMELLQNADDNDYLETVLPTLHIKLYREKIVVCNNEVGFTEKNIGAICSIGKSTKAGKRGYIGQKGIGFKSVFAVSNFPEVHSNGFHIKFDREKSMIEPMWINNSSEWPTMIDPQTNDVYSTCLCLNLDQDSMKKFIKLNQDIEDVFDGCLILFLNKVQCMILDDKCRNRSVKHTNQILSDSWTLLQSEYVNDDIISQAVTQSSYWYRRKVTFNPRMKRQKNDDNESDSSEVIIALKFAPLRKDSSLELKLDYDGLLPVYAYLPTKTTLFYFIIQGDFVLGTSREGILENEHWNLVLLSQIPAIVSEIITEFSLWHLRRNNECPHLQEFMSHDVSGVIKIDPADIFRLIPRFHMKMRESDPFFKLIKDIHVSLTQTAWLPSQSGVVCSPKQLFLKSDVDLGAEFSDEFVSNCTGRHFLHKSYRMDNELASILEIPVFGVTDVLDCLEKYISSVNESQPEYDRPTVTRRVVSILLAIELMTSSSPKLSNRNDSLIPSGVIVKNLQRQAKPVSPSVINRLKCLNIWLLKRQSKLTRLPENSIVYTYGHSTLNSGQKIALEMFIDNVDTIDDEMFDIADSIQPDGRKALRRFFKSNFKPFSGSQFGIEDLEVDVIIKNIILPCYSSFDSISTTLTRQHAAAYLSFLFHSSALVKNEVNKVLMNSGFIIPTCVPRSTDHGIVWKAHCLRVSRPFHTSLNRFSLSSSPEYEIHLGIEFKEFESATCQLAKSHPTALAQLRWEIVDPFVASLVSGKPESDRNVHLRDYEKNWKKFLFDIGVVDFFGVYSITRPENDLLSPRWEAPFLFQYLNHMTRNGKVSSDDSNDRLCLFFPSDKALFVSEVVYDSMKTSAMLINRTLKDLIERRVDVQPESQPYFMSLLNETPWYPAWTNESLISVDSKYYYVVTSPRNITIDVDGRTNQIWNNPNFSLGPHTLCSHHQPLRDTTLIPYLKFQANSRMGDEVYYSPDLALQYLRWMVNREKEVYYSIALTKKMHKFVLGILSNPGHDTFRAEVLKLILEDRPLIWFPRLLPSTEADPWDQSDIVLGDLVPLSRVIEKDFIDSDNPKKFTWQSCPQIRVLSDYYSSDELGFSVKKCCRACQAVEGLFGARGGLHSSSLGEQKCICNKTSYQKIFPDLTGLVRKSPSLLDLIEVIKVYSKDMEALSSQSASDIIARQKQIITDNTKSVYENISKNIWKCFHIDSCLHPYSPSSLSEAINQFKSNNLIMTIDGNFTSIQAIERESRKCYAIDDKLMYSMNSDVIESLRSDGVILIDATPLEKALNNTFFTYVDEVDVSYDLEAYHQRCMNFLNLDPKKFNDLANQIPGETFFAPSNSKSLMKFLNIPLLSSIITCNIEKSGETKSGVRAREMLSYMNILLSIAQAKMKASLGDIYFSFDHANISRLEYFPKLLAIEIVECSDLSKVWTVMDSEDRSSAQPIPYYFDINEGRIYVSSSESILSRSQLLELCIGLIMSGIRVDVALTRKNQMVEEMALIEAALLRISKQNMSDRDIEYFCKFEEIEVLSEDLRWKLLKGIAIEEDIEIKPTSMDEALDSQTAAALAGFESLKQSSQKKRAPTKRDDSGYSDFLSQKKAEESRLDAEILQHLSENKSAVEIDDRTDQLSKLSYTPLLPTETASALPRGDVVNRMPDFTIVRSSTAYTSVGENSIPQEAARAELSGNQGMQYLGVSVGSASSPSAAQDPISQRDRIIGNAIFQRTYNDIALCSFEPSEVTQALKSVESIGSASLLMTNHAMSGRLGESLAYTYLRGKFDSSTTVTWKNEASESLLPYDILFEREEAVDGRPWIKYCEVKTRVVDLTPPTQWFISSSEIEFALLKGEEYCCALVSITIDKASNEFKSYDMILVGVEKGLANSLASKEANLIIQVLRNGSHVSGDKSDGLFNEA